MWLWQSILSFGIYIMNIWPAMRHVSFIDVAQYGGWSILTA
jgi:hypothetical protein